MKSRDTSLISFDPENAQFVPSTLRWMHAQAKLHALPQCLSQVL